MDGNLVRANEIVLKGIDAGWKTKKIEKEIYNRIPIFMEQGHHKYMYGVITYPNQVVLVRIESAHLNNVVEIVFIIGD